MNIVEQINNLDFYNKRVYSQFGEEIIAEAILNQIGVKNKFFVDIGAGSYDNSGESNTKYFKEKGWNGLSFDANGGENIIKDCLFTYNLLPRLKRYNCPFEYDFLNVDIDSFDYEFIDKILGFGYKPSLICAEFNATLPKDSSLKLKYEEGYMYDWTNKYGFSFKAGEKMLKKHNYTIVYNQMNINIFAVRDELINFNLSEIEHKQEFYHKENPLAIWEEV